LPAAGERPRLGLAIADDTGGDQPGIVERGAVRVRERIAELAPLVDRAGGFGRNVTGNASGKRKLLEQALHALLVLRYLRIALGVGALEVGIRDERRPTVARPGHEQHRKVARDNCAVQVCVDEIETWRGPPVAEEPRLDVVEGERSLEQRVR